jgi:hypothetical protein
MLNTMPVEQAHLIKALEEFIKQILPTNANVDIPQLARDTANLLQKQMANVGEKLTVDKLADSKLINQVKDNVEVLSGLKNNPVLIKQLNITEEKLADPKYFNKLLNQVSVATKLTEKIKNTPELKKRLDKVFEALPLGNEKFMHELKLLLNKKNNPNLKTDFKNLLIKHLGPLKTGEVYTNTEIFMQALLKETPEMKGKKTQVDDPYINLLGVLNSYITGSLPVPTPQDMGNGLAIPDMNPYNGSANIDKAHNMDFSWGDSIGLEQKSVDTLEQLGSVFASAIENAGIQTHLSPSPFQTAPKPPDKT